MFCNLSVIFQIENIWGRNFSGANYSGRNVTEAKQREDEMSPVRQSGGEVLLTKHRWRNIRIVCDFIDPFQYCLDVNNDNI